MVGGAIDLETGYKRFSYYKKPTAGKVNLLKADKSIGRNLFPKRSSTEMASYDFDVSVIKETQTSRVPDFTKTRNHAHQKSLDPQTLDLMPLLQQSKSKSRARVLVQFERPGREDNLLYRSTEMARNIMHDNWKADTEK